MKKILFYIDTMRRGGAQRVMSDLITYFHDNGYETVLCNEFVVQDDVPQYSVSPEVKRVYLAQDNSGQVLVKNAKKLLALRKIIQTEKPDLTLSFLGRPNIRLLLASVGLQCRKIVSVRNDPHKEYGATRLKRLLTRWLFCLADGCVFQTQAAADYFSDDLRQRSQVISNPVGEAFFAVRRSEQTKNIVTLGRLFEQKNHFLLIQAFSFIADRFPDEALMIYGEGALKESLAQYVQELGLGHRVHLMGDVREVPSILERAKIFALSSDYEGMPNALMEALAAGVPSVSTDCPCGGPAALIENGLNGLLVPVNHVNAMADAMAKLLDDRRMAEQLGQNAKKRAEAFRAEVVLRQWETYMQHITTHSAR